MFNLFSISRYENIFQRKQNFKAKHIENKNPFICQSGKIKISISQGQNNQFVIIMLKSNVKSIHMRKIMNHLLKSYV